MNGAVLPTDAGDAFCLAADVQMRLDVKHEAGSNLVEAGQVYKREDPKSERILFAAASFVIVWDGD